MQESFICTSKWLINERVCSARSFVPSSASKACNKHAKLMLNRSIDSYSVAAVFIFCFHHPSVEISIPSYITSAAAFISVSSQSKIISLSLCLLAISTYPAATFSLENKCTWLVRPLGSKPDMECPNLTDTKRKKMKMRNYTTTAPAPSSRKRVGSETHHLCTHWRK